jgi:hypothetical protein
MPKSMGSFDEYLCAILKYLGMRGLYQGVKPCSGLAGSGGSFRVDVMACLLMRPEAGYARDPGQGVSLLRTDWIFYSSWTLLIISLTTKFI